jgi:hypothetical protein
MTLIKCPECGTNISDQAATCPKCGKPSSPKDVTLPAPERRSWLIALLLCIFLGALGAHRFYVGKIGTGLLQLLTLGGCGIWALIDVINILIGGFKDINGYSLKK